MRTFATAAHRPHMSEIQHLFVCHWWVRTVQVSSFKIDWNNKTADNFSHLGHKSSMLALSGSRDPQYCQYLEECDPDQPLNLHYSCHAYFTENIFPVLVWNRGLKLRWAGGHCCRRHLIGGPHQCLSNTRKSTRLPLWGLIHQPHHLSQLQHLHACCLLDKF